MDEDALHLYLEGTCRESDHHRKGTGETGEFPQKGFLHRAQHASTGHDGALTSQYAQSMLLLLIRTCPSYHNHFTPSHSKSSASTCLFYLRSRPRALSHGSAFRYISHVPAEVNNHIIYQCATYHSVSSPSAALPERRTQDPPCLSSTTADIWISDPTSIHDLLPRFKVA